ncbi:MAG: carbohydrate-binding domain-containing protein, partial [Clostridiales bacterium]|nr:carbohydrate-binding domain-containing protein [Clostridiales bacterium]
MKKFIVLLLAVCLISVVPLLAKTADSEYIIELSEKSILVNGGAVSKSKSPVYLQNITETHPDVAEEYKNTANSVITISAEGTYRVKGSRENCQILIDAGENDRVRLILDGAEIRCKTAPAILVKSAYDPLKAGDAGVTIELAANSKNSVYGATGANNNGAVSSDVSVTLNGGGYLDITAENEGIETQKHLTVNGGIITINS